MQACTYVAPPPAVPLNHTALWWNPAEAGWGVNINHQDSTLFATLFTYTSSNAPMWLVASSLSQQPDGAYSGSLYRLTGPAFNRAPWDGVSVVTVGSMTIRFSGENAGTITYNVGSTTVSKHIEKQVFGALPACVAVSSSRAAATNYQDLWWNPEESGWGVNLTHQGAVIFATLFTYDNAGKDIWLVASNMSRQGDGSFSGLLYSMTGPAFNASPWSAAKAAEAGSITLRFTSGDRATLAYTYSGVAVSKTIQRQVFGAMAPMCR
jgi:hypothetical protein